jgi:transposase-like protein
MAYRVPEEKKQLLAELYRQEISIREIARRANVPFSTAYNYTRLLERINPETGQPFESQSQYDAFLAQQRTDPSTGRPYKSLPQYERKLKKRRQARPRNKRLSQLLRGRLAQLGKTGTSVANELGLSRQRFSMYVCGTHFPSAEVLESIVKALGLPDTTIDELLE